MAKYIDEYLVALGFDLNSEQGKEYLKMCDDIEERNKQLEKSGKSASDQAQKNANAQQAAINGNRRQNDSENQLYESRKKRRNKPQEAPQKANPEPVSTVEETVPQPVEQPTPEEVPEEQPTPTHKAPEQPEKRPASTYQEPEQPQEQPKTAKEPPKQTAAPTTPQNTIKGLSQSVKQLGNAWSQFERGNIFSAFEQGAASVRSFRNYVDNLSPGFSNADTKAVKLSKTLHGLFGGKEVKTAAETLGGAGKDATEAGASAAELGSGAGLAAAAGIVGGVTLTTKAIWNMSDGLTQANTNVQTMARTLWITDSAAWQLNNTLSAMGKTTADLNEISINPTLNKQFKALQQEGAQYDTSGVQKASEKWAAVQTEWQKVNLNAGVARNGFIAKIEDTLAPIFQGVLKGWNGLEEKMAEASGAKTTTNNTTTTSTYAPQSYSYATNNQGGSVTYSPHIEVKADSNSAQDIASATASATQQTFNNAALIKNIQGMYR